jgi:hypothetical protein
MSTATFSLRASGVSNQAERGATRSYSNVRAKAALSVDEGQLYYWSATWQENERIVRAELARGEGRAFDSADELLAWLDSDD